MSKSQTDENLLGKNLQSLRKRYGETLKEAGAQLYLSRSAIKNYESGERMPNLEIIRAIAKHYSITVDELLYNDLSGNDKIDFPIQGMGAVTSAWEVIVPLVKSDAAMKNQEFQRGYNKCRSIIDHFSKNEAVTNLDVSECFDCFINAIEVDVTEAMANLLWLVFLNWSQIMDRNMADVFTSIIYPRKNQESTVKKLMKAKQCISDEVRLKRLEFIHDCDDAVYSLIKELKHDPELAELGDYYIGLKYLCGMEDTGHSQEMNEAIGLQMLISLLKSGNSYAFNTLKMVLSFR